MKPLAQRGLHGELLRARDSGAQHHRGQQPDPDSTHEDGLADHAIDHAMASAFEVQIDLSADWFVLSGDSINSRLSKSNCVNARQTTRAESLMRLWFER